MYTKDENFIVSKRLFPNYAHVYRRSQLAALHDFLLEKKSRRMQATWFYLADALHTAQFFNGKLIMEQSLKAEKAFKLISKTGFIIENEPDFLFDRGKPRILKGSINFGNGSDILGIPQGDKQLLSETVSYWFSDEAAQHDLLERAITGSVPALEGGGKARICSSVRPGYFNELSEDVPVGDITMVRKLPKQIIVPMKGMREWQNIYNPFYFTTSKLLNDSLSILFRGFRRYGITGYKKFF